MAELIQTLYSFSKPTRLVTIKQATQGSPSEVQLLSDVSGNMDYGLVAAGSQMWGSELINVQELGRNGVIDSAYYRIYHDRFKFPVYVGAGAGIKPVESDDSKRKKLFWQIALVLGVGIGVYGFFLTRKRQ